MGQYDKLFRYLGKAVLVKVVVTSADQDHASWEKYTEVLKSGQPELDVLSAPHHGRDETAEREWWTRWEERVFMVKGLSGIYRAAGLVARRGSRPPGAAKFALLMIPKRSREHMIGDLEEEYRTVLLPEYGLFKARAWYWGQTLLAVGNYLWPLLKRVLGLAAIWKVMGG